MKKSFVIISAVAAIVFDFIACLGDGNTVIYNLFMGLCCAAFCVYVAVCSKSVSAKRRLREQKSAHLFRRGKLHRCTPTQVKKSA